MFKSIQFQDRERIALKEAIDAQLQQLLSVLGRGEMLSVAYDTGWLARLSLRYPDKGFDGAYDWLLRSQHADGSWGSAVPHYHDRVICTLSALVALQLKISDKCDPRIEKGLDYIWRTMSYLYADANDTINFRGIASLLLSEATDLGLDVPQSVYYKYETSAGKLSRLYSRPDIWAKHPISYSLECFHPTLPEATFMIADNGSIGVSPAASAALLLNSTVAEPRILEFLSQAVRPDGGIPTVVPIDLFEIAWSLNVLRQTAAISPDDPPVKRLLDRLWQKWSATEGVSHSSYFPIPDLDDTATAFVVLHWAGYPVDLSVFAYYEEADHFRCYIDETDPSLSAHIRLLAALKASPDDPDAVRWTKKILAFLQDHAQGNKVWTDKWHISPFYLRAAAVAALHTVDDQLAAEHFKWIVKNQHDDGGWGYYGVSTPEETAYALQAILHWHQHVEAVDDSCMTYAAQYLAAHLNDSSYVPLWIGKCLYTPQQVVHAAVLSALQGYVHL